MQSCKISNNKLIALLNNELPAEESKAVKEHIEKCSRCEKLYFELEQTYMLISEKRILKPNPYLYTRIEQKLKNIEQEKVLRPKYIQVLQPVLFSFVLILVFWGSLKLGDTYTKIYEQDKNTLTYSTEYYLNDLEQENLELILLND